MVARLASKGGFSSYTVFNKHERLDTVANAQKQKTPEGIRYMMEFVAKLSTAVYPAKVWLFCFIYSWKDCYHWMGEFCWCKWL